jgi:thiamine biosynthesis lipoprotein ApbE
MLIHAADVSAMAIATSAPYFCEGRGRIPPVTSCIDMLRRRPSRARFSVSVAASDCMTADALTKVALLRGPAAVRRFGATAMTIFGPGASLHRLR